MNKKRWFWASVAAFAISMILGYVFNNICLCKLYKETASLWRPMEEMNKLMPYGFLIDLICSFILVFIYAKGYEGKSSRIAEGLRFGLMMGIFIGLPMAGWTYITQPLPFIMAFYWFLMTVFEMLVIGAVVGLIYKK